MDEHKLSESNSGTSVPSIQYSMASLIDGGTDLCSNHQPHHLLFHNLSLAGGSGPEPSCHDDVGAECALGGSMLLNDRLRGS